jgi:hypothetical protein
VGKWEKNGLPHGFKRQAEQHDGIVFALARKEPRTWEEARLEIPAGTAANQFVTGVAKPVGGGAGQKQPETARDAVPWRLQKSEKESGLAVEEANIKDQLREDTSIIFFSNQLRHFPIPQLAYHICDQNTILEKQQGAKISLSASCSSLRNFSGHYNVVTDRISFSERLMVGCFGCPYCNYQKLGDKQWL